MKYTSYKHYILANRIPDSKAAYETYLRQYTTTFNGMSQAMIIQHVEVSYKYRFAIQF